MTFNELKDFFKKNYEAYDNGSDIMVGHFIFLREGAISFCISNHDEQHQNSIYVLIAKNRTPEQMKNFLESVM